MGLLESVWQAADSDPYCDAYVIPIPYYDKNLMEALDRGIMRLGNIQVMCQWYVMRSMILRSGDLT